MPTHHVIVGGGPVATNALETIRQYETDSQITLVCDEPAHSRMALPYWLAGQIPKEHTHTADDAYYKKLNVEAKDNFLSKQLNDQANQLVKEMSQLSGAEFDRRYAENELGYHKTVVDLVGNTFIPNIENPEVKALFEEANVIFLSNASALSFTAE